MNTLPTLALMCSLLLLSACATRPDSVQATVVDKDEYADYSCAELRETFTQLRANETKISDQMNSTANSQVGANVLGGLLMAATGFGFTRTVNNSGHAEALAEVRGHLSAVKEQAQTISCALPAQAKSSD